MRQQRGRWIGAWLLLFGVLVLGGAERAAGQPGSPAPAPAPSPFEADQARLDSQETLKTLSDEGALLYERERLKLSGYQYCSQAVAQAERGDFRESLQSAAKALHVGRMQGNEDLIALSKRDFSIAYSYAGDLVRAKQYANEALLLHPKDLSVVAGPAYKTLGDVAARSGDLAGAIDYYGRAASIASERYRPLVQISLANAYVASKDAAHARTLYDTLPALPVALEPLHQRGLGNLLLLEGRSAEALKAFDAAAQSATGADASYHRLWAVEGSARALLELGDRAGARERYVRAAQLSEQIRAHFRSEEFKTGLFSNVQQIFDRAIGLLAESGDDAGAWSLSERSRARALLDTVRERAPAPSPTRSGLSEATELVAIADVMAALGERTTLVQFHSLDDRLLVWTLNAGGIKGTSLPIPRAELDRLTDTYQAVFKEWTTKRRFSSTELSKTLHERLIAPLALPIGDVLLIVPHRNMHYIPFQALGSRSEGFLIDHNAIAIEPSASVAVQLRRRDTQPASTLVAFGNPALNLPAADREVGEIAKLFADPQVRLHQDASKSNFRQLAGSGRILHVATHAYVDDIDPLQSSLLLAEEVGETPRIAAREIYGMDLSAVSLVALSACSSGLGRPGRIADGDDIVGFTRSFLTAGAKALLVSLWNVNDASTELLMTTFYDRLTQGATAIEALRAGQLAVMNDPANPNFADPHYWAPFNLVGDWRLRVSH